VEPTRRIPATFVAGDKAGWLNLQSSIIAQLAKIDESRLKIVEQLAEKPKNAVAVVEGATEIFLPLEGMVDLSAERARLEKELAALTAQIAKSESLLASDFVSKAPAPVIERERVKLAAAQESRAKVQARLWEM
jgi:valyl-tRNA synthetase